MHQADAENQGGPGDMLGLDVACEPAKKNVWSRDRFVQNKNRQGSWENEPNRDSRWMEQVQKICIESMEYDS